MSPTRKHFTLYLLNPNIYHHPLQLTWKQFTIPDLNTDKSVRPSSKSANLIKQIEDVVSAVLSRVMFFLIFYILDQLKQSLFVKVNQELPETNIGQYPSFPTLGKKQRNQSINDSAVSENFKIIFIISNSGFD